MLPCLSSTPSLWPKIEPTCTTCRWLWPGCPWHIFRPILLTDFGLSTTDLGPVLLMSTSTVTTFTRRQPPGTVYLRLSILTFGILDGSLCAQRLVKRAPIAKCCLGIKQPRFFGVASMRRERRPACYVQDGRGSARSATTCVLPVRARPAWLARKHGSWGARFARFARFARDIGLRSLQFAKLRLIANSSVARCMPEKRKATLPSGASSSVSSRIGSQMREVCASNRIQVQSKSLEDRPCMPSVCYGLRVDSRRVNWPQFTTSTSTTNTSTSTTTTGTLLPYSTLSADCPESYISRLSLQKQLTKHPPV